MEKWYETWKELDGHLISPLNLLNYLNRPEERFINLEYNWNGNFFVQMKIGKFVDVNWSNLEITLKIMKKYLEIYWKPGKVMEFSQSGKVGTLYFPVREFWTDWKNRGKIQNTEKFRELQTIVICYIF